MQALLVANPKATSTNQRARDLLVRAFAGDLEVDLAETAYRGHAVDLAAEAVTRGVDIVIALGGDGTVNEVVNGLLAHELPAGALPGLAVLPGGSANVFARALGLPNDPLRSIASVLGALRAGRTRTIGLGHVATEEEKRYFTFSAGVGWDAEVVHAVEQARLSGARANPGLYVRAALRQYFAITDRRNPSLRIEDSDGRIARDVFLAIISNTAPWTFLGPRPVNPSPRASFDKGLDLFGMRSADVLPTVAALAQMLTPPLDQAPQGRHVLELHDTAEITIGASRPTAFQLDGEYLGRRERLLFRSVPDAIRIVI
ncbi:MAG: diacylglycerol kinase family protein [Streptosporangiaceae bacterium]